MITLPTSRREQAWWIARAIGALALFAYYLRMLIGRFNNAFHEYSINGDQIQGAWQYWRYHVKGALPEGQLLTDYAFAYHSPPFHRAWIALLSIFVQPLQAAAITDVITWTLLVLGVVYVVGKHSEWLLGILAGFIAVRNPDAMLLYGTGIARSWGPPLCIWFIAAFLEKKHVACLVLLVLAAGMYPVIAMGCGIAYGAYTVVAGPMRDRVKRMAGMLVAGVLIIGLGLYQDLQSPKWWGPLVTMEQAEKMPAWHARGRFHELPMPSWQSGYLWSIARVYRGVSDGIAPKSAADFVNRHAREVFVYTPSLLAALAIAFDRWRRLRTKAPPPDVDMEPRWQFLAVWAGAAVGYFIARTFAYRFFIPERQLTYVVPFVIQSGLPLLVWCGARAVVGHRRALAVAITAAITVAPAFVLLGDGLENRAYYKDHRGAAPLWRFIRTLPLDANIAADPYVANFMGGFTYHAAWANQTMTHPIRIGLYEEEERRLVEQYRALFATSFEQLAAFAEREHIDYFVYSLGKLEGPDPTYEPAKSKIDAIFRASKGHMVLANPPAEAVIFNWKEYRVLDMKKLVAWVASGAANDASTPSMPSPGPATPPSSSTSSQSTSGPQSTP